jgi:hypothetical protein
MTMDDTPSASLLHAVNLLPSTRFSPPTSIRHPQKRAFLAAYAEAGTINASARAVGIERHTHNDWLASDADYREGFTQAKAAFCDHLEEMAFARVRAQSPKDSPLLLICLLNAHLPEKYRPNQQPTDDRAIELLAKLREMSRVQGKGQAPALGEAGGATSEDG